MQFEWISGSAGKTRAFGQWLGEHAVPGLVIALVGDLGVGKTRLVQGLALGLGVPSCQHVTSPTYNLLNSYNGRMTLHHMDVYRLACAEEMELLGVRDLLGGDSVTVVEWADRFPEVLPGRRLEVELHHRSARTRLIRCVLPEDEGELAIMLRLSEWMGYVRSGLPPRFGSPQAGDLS